MTIRQQTFNGPVAFAKLTQAERDTLVQDLGLTLWNVDSGFLETWSYDRWAQFVLASPIPSHADTVTYNATTGLWVPTPSQTPLLNTLKVYGDNTSILEVKRIYSGLAKTGTGTGTMVPSGIHTNAGNVSYRVKIDSAGTLDWWDGVTFTWSNDGGATWEATGVSITTGAAGRRVLAPVPLENGVEVLFGEGTYVANDRWDWTAIAIGSQLYDLQVDTTNSVVKVGTQLVISNDANFRLVGTGNNVCYYIVGVSTSLVYNRSLDTWTFYRNGSLEVLRLEPGNVHVVQDNLKVDLFIDFKEQLSPDTPAADRAFFWAKDAGGLSQPHWKDEAATETNLLRSVADGLLGDGSDGAVTISSNTTLTRSMFYSSLTVDATFTLFPGGYKVFCTGTVTVNGTISRAGAVGTSASGTTGGGGGAGVAAVEVGGGGAAGAGKDGGTAAGTAGGPATSLSVAMGGAQGIGGIGGNGSSGSGGAAGTIVSWTTRMFRALSVHLLSGASVINGGAGGGGGGSGGGDGTAGGGSGGGGSGGGVLQLFANTITVGAAGVITAAGGNGGAGGTPAGGNRGGGAGGGAGGGGFIYLLYRTLTNNGSITVAGGTGGTKGLKTGTGTDGADGANGSAGTLLKYNLSVGAFA